MIDNSWLVKKRSVTACGVWMELKFPYQGHERVPKC